MEQGRKKFCAPCCWVPSLTALLWLGVRLSLSQRSSVRSPLVPSSVCV
jgi:hypothetical protein